MSEFNSIMPPELILTRGEAYTYHLAHNHITHDEVVKDLILKQNTPLKEIGAIENDVSASEQLATAIKIASTDLTRFVKDVNRKCIKSRRAIKDRKPIFVLSNYPLLRKAWNGVLLRPTPEGSKPQYLNVFISERYDANMADVKMMSSDGVTFLLNKLYLASASMMLRNIFADIVPTMDDGAAILVHTNIPSDELKSLVQFIMFGQIDCGDQCPNCCKGEAIFDLLKDFGIDMNGNSFTLSHSKKNGQPEEEILYYSCDSNRFNEAEDVAFNCKEEREMDVSFDESQNNALIGDPFIKGIETAQVSHLDAYVNNEKYVKNELLTMSHDNRPSNTVHFGNVQNYTDLLSGIEMGNIVKQEMDTLLQSDESFDSLGSVDSIEHKKNQKRKSKLQGKKKVHGNTGKRKKKKDLVNQETKKIKGPSKEQKPFMELSREGQKARVGEFFDSFLKQSQILGISDGSFAGYLGYIATVDGEPWVASTFKWLHEGITGDEKLKDTENKVSNASNGSDQTEPTATVLLGSTQNAHVKQRPPFLDLSYEEKMNQVGDFFEAFVEKANQLHISPTSFAAYLGMKVTYVTDRLAASTFSKLYDGSDKREKWRFSLGPKEVKCVACGKRFQGEKMTFLSIRLKGHMKTVHPSFEYKCISCGESVETWEDHVKHTNEFHNGEMKMQCNSCDLIFSSRAEIRSHKLTFHTASRPEIVCAECGKKLTPASMEDHMKTEHGQEHVACPKCPKILKHPIALERHLKTNHDECQCEECGKVCNSATGLKRHMLTTHTPDNLKPYKCTHCSKGFNESTKLKDHMNVHLGVKPFSCEKCSQAFSNNSNRLAHIRSVHRGLKRTKKFIVGQVL